MAQKSILVGTATRTRANGTDPRAFDQHHSDKSVAVWAQHWRCWCDGSGPTAGEECRCKTVVLFQMPFGEVGVASLGKALKVSSTLTTFILSANCVGADGAVSLCQALQTNASLESLQLDTNGIGDCGAVAIANRLTENRSLNTVGLQWNDICDEGVHAFLDMIETRMRMSPFHQVRVRLGKCSWHCALQEATEKVGKHLTDRYSACESGECVPLCCLRLFQLTRHQQGVSWSGSSNSLRNRRTLRKLMRSHNFGIDR
jgi:Leucine Rich repeat